MAPAVHAAAHLAGISVATAPDGMSDCFGNYPSYWQFTHDVVTIEDYTAFATQAREELWRGL